LCFARPDESGLIARDYLTEQLPGIAVEPLQIGWKSPALVDNVMPGNNIGGTTSLRLAACLMTFSRVRFPPAVLRTRTRVSPRI
jgi:hypothetical protein